MLESISEFVSNAAVFLAVTCGLTFAFAGLMTLFIMNQYKKAVEPDISKIKAQYDHMCKAHPEMKHEQVIRKVIHQQALKAGAVGAVTSLGGFYTLPVALPLDIYLSTRIQSTLVDFIADVFNEAGADTDMEVRIRRYIISSGGATVSQRSSAWITRYLLRLSGRTFAKVIPFFGAFVGFAVNYTFTQATGNLALRWYAKRPATDGQVIVSE